VGAEGAEGSCDVSVEGSCKYCALTEKACLTSARSRFRPAHLPVQYEYSMVQYSTVSMSEYSPAHLPVQYGVYGECMV
jgi:hypothetical protein